MPPLSRVPVDPGASGMAFVAVSDLDRALAFYVDTLGSSVLTAPSDEQPDVCVVRGPEGSGETSVTLVRVGVRRAPHAGAATSTTDAALQADIELSRVDDATVDDAGLWRTPQGDVVTWFRDPAGGIASLAHRAA